MVVAHLCAAASSLKTIALNVHTKTNIEYINTIVRHSMLFNWWPSIERPGNVAGVHGHLLPLNVSTQLVKIL